MAPSISVCIPHYGKPSDYLALAVGSALAALPDDGEVLVLADGPDATRTAQAAGLAPSVRVVASERPVGLVANWNRCFAEAAGRLVHLLHDDDAVAPGFYRAILELERGCPQATLLATGFSYFERMPPPPRAGAARPECLSGAEAASLLLRQGRHVCGSVVVPAAVFAQEGPYDERYAYCPDEEAYQRFASLGGVALDDRPLYFERIHPGQERFRTWRRDDFVRTYVEARVAGARCFGPEQEQLARDVTARNVTRLAIRLAAEGQPQEGARRLEELAAVLPGVRDDRLFGVASWVCRRRVGRLAARAAFGPLWAVWRLRGAMARRAGA